MSLRLPFVIVVLAFAVGVAGQNPPPPAWQPVAPEGLPTEFDWIHLSSHE